MKRWLVAAMAAVLLVSMSAVAFADDEVEGDAEDAVDLNEVQLWRAESLGSYFAERFAGEDAEPGDVDEAAEGLTETIVEFRTGDDRVGWGALYKLMLLAEYQGEDLSTVAERLRSDGGWGFGKAMKELRKDADWASESDTPKNFGQWKKQQRKNASSDD